MDKLPFNDQELEKMYEKATQAGRKLLASEPRIEKAWFNRIDHRVMVELNNGSSFAFNPEYCRGLRDASDEDLSQVEVTPMGQALHWEKLDTDFSIVSLLNGRFGGKKWMEAMRKQYGIPIGIWPDSKDAMTELGRIGGQSKSLKKAAAPKINGKKGGRAPKSQQASA